MNAGHPGGHTGGRPELNVEELRRGGVVKLKEKDMYSIWVRAICDNMDAKKLRKVADISDSYGRGYILFSTRQFPIIPHIHFNDIQAVKQELEEVELMLDRCGARVRNADVCYDINICPYAILNPISLGEKLDQFWRDDAGGFKIKTSINGCEKQCTSPRVLADLGFVAATRRGKTGYDVYLGGKLGLDPFVGVRMAELLSEGQCLRFVKNYVDFINKEGQEGERAAALIRRLGEDYVRAALKIGIENELETEPFVCDTKQADKQNNVVLRIRATNGEVNSTQARKIADIAENYGLGFVHFSVRGGPEIPGVKKELFEKIRGEINQVGLDILDSGIDNLQSCFGGYCTNGNLDTQPFLRRIEELVRKIGLNDLNIKISASGCPNSCGVSHLSDIGYIGIVEPEIDAEKCNGCNICPRACRPKAIEIINKLAVIDYDKCKNCDTCVKSCPFDAIKIRKEGILVLVGGRGAHFMDDKNSGETKLAQKLIDFIDEDRAVEITEKILLLVRAKGKTVSDIVDEIGFEKFKGAVI